MHYVHKITEKMYWVGGNDRRLERFENMFPIPKGVSYNSYLFVDEKTVLLDTVDASIRNQYLENVRYVLNGRKLDYLIINHMEPDHCGVIEDLLNIYPELKIVGNAKTFQLFEQFYNSKKPENYYKVDEGDTLNVGEHTFEFLMMPMVHWPEVMGTYEQSQKIFFSADAFGTFGTINGNIFADQTDFEGFYLSEARRYYSNIVGKYGLQVQNVFKKLSNKEIEMICSLHGPVWRKNSEYILDKYQKWSTYTPEKQGVLLFYASMYGNTENVIDIIAGKLSEKGVEDIRVFDVSKTHPSYIIAEAWKYSNFVIGSPSYNAGLYHVMDALLHELASLGMQNRKISLVGNYSWASSALKVMGNYINGMKNIERVGEELEINSSLKEENMEKLDDLVNKIYSSLI